MSILKRYLKSRAECHFKSLTAKDMSYKSWQTFSLSRMWPSHHGKPFDCQRCVLYVSANPLTAKDMSYASWQTLWPPKTCPTCHGKPFDCQRRVLHVMANLLTAKDVSYVSWQTFWLPKTCPTCQRKPFDCLHAGPGVGRRGSCPGGNLFIAGMGGPLTLTLREGVAQFGPKFPLRKKDIQEAAGFVSWALSATVLPPF